MIMVVMGFSLLLLICLIIKGMVCNEKYISHLIMNRFFLFIPSFFCSHLLAAFVHTLMPHLHLYLVFANLIHVS